MPIIILTVYLTTITLLHWTASPTSNQNEHICTKHNISLSSIAIMRDLLLIVYLLGVKCWAIVTSIGLTDNELEHTRKRIPGICRIQNTSKGLYTIHCITYVGLLRPMYTQSRSSTPRIYIRTPNFDKPTKRDTKRGLTTLQLTEKGKGECWSIWPLRNVCGRVRSTPTSYCGSPQFK
jgi:hypothetical protein